MYVDMYHVPPELETGDCNSRSRKGTMAARYSEINNIPSRLLLDCASAS